MKPNRQKESERKKIGEILVEMGFVTPAQLKKAIKLAKEKSIRTGEALFEMGVLDLDHIYWVLGNQMNMNYLQLLPEMIDENLLKKFPLNTLEELQCIPLYEIENEIHFAIADPGNAGHLKRLRELTKDKNLNLHLALPEKIAAIIKFFRGQDLLPQDSISAERQEPVLLKTAPMLPGGGMDSDSLDLIQVLISVPGGMVFMISQSAAEVRLWRLEQGRFMSIRSFPAAALKTFLEDLRKSAGAGEKPGAPFWISLKAPEGDAVAFLRCHVLAGIGTSLFLIERLPDFVKDAFFLQYPGCRDLILEIRRHFQNRSRLLIGSSEGTFLKQCIYLALGEMRDVPELLPALFVEKNILMRFPAVIQTEMSAFQRSGLLDWCSVNPTPFLLYEGESLPAGDDPLLDRLLSGIWDRTIIILPFQNHEEMGRYLGETKTDRIGQFDSLYIDSRSLYEFTEKDSSNRGSIGYGSN